MPPKAKITKEMILNAVLDITRQTGFKAVNARSIADRLQCSTRPLFTCYENMDALKKEFLDFSFAFYSRYVADYGRTASVVPCLLYPLSYLAFAQEEPNLFQFLFLSDMDLDMKKAEDFYRETGNEDKAKAFSEETGIETEYAKAVFLDLFLYTHGMAVLTATGKLALNRDDAERMLLHFLTALIRQKKPDWKPVL